MANMISSEFNDLLEFDELQLYFGDDYIINADIKVHQPTIDEIYKFGEKKYYQMIHMLTVIPSDMKSQLWDKGIDWNKISDFDLFVMLTRGMTSEQTSILLGDIDLSKMETSFDKTTEENVLYDFERKIVIDSLIYTRIVSFIRKMHGIVSKPEKAKNKFTKEILVNDDRERLLNLQSKKQNDKSQLKELISAMMRFPGCKYTKNELRNCGLYEFMDLVQGAQIYVSTTALLQGMYSGMIDTSKITNKNEFNWLRSA